MASDPLDAAQPATEARPSAGFVPPKPHELADHFPQFEILDLLGYGGMGAVYKARQKSLDRLVALKIIKPDAVNDRGFAERFAREAKALAKLNHSNIVGVYDFGQSSHHAPRDEPSAQEPGSEANGDDEFHAGSDKAHHAERDGHFMYYFVMEYVDGINLRRLIESKELSPEQALKIIPQVCEALQYAHDERIVHRDIKPENILVDSRGRVKIADFGLAKLLGKTSINDHTLTGTHQVMGTPRYMAPEQMEGSKTIDHRADIYSLGVVFYEMLTGELPMGNFEPPSRKASVDARLDQVVLRSLAKERERRYQHASDVKTDVESISQAARADAPAEAWSTRVRNDELSPDSRASIAGFARDKTELMRVALFILFFGSVAGLITLFTPWAHVEIVGLGRPFNAEVEGYRYGLPIVGAMLSLALSTFTLYKTIVGEFPSAARGMLAAATGLTLAATGAAIFLLAPLPNLADEYSTVLREAGHHFTDSSYSMRELQILEMQGQVDLQVDTNEAGCFMSMLLGVALLVASALEMRTVIVSQAERAPRNVAELLRRPSTALRWAAWSSPLMIPVLIAMNVGNSGWRSGLSTLLLVMLVLQVLHALLILPLILIGISRMEAFLSRRLATAVCILSMVPLGLSFVFGLPAGIWALIVLARPEVERAFRKRTVEPHIVEQQLQRDNPPLNWSRLIVGLCVVSPVLVLIGFALWYAQTAWVLAALAIPWLGVCADQAYQEELPGEKSSEKAAKLLLLFTFLLTIGLIALAIAIENSAWPLCGLAPALVGGFVGFGLGYMAGEAHAKSKSAAAVDDDSADEKEEEEAEEDEEESPEEKLEWAAWWIGVIGAVRAWGLLSGGGEVFEKIIAGEASLLNHSLLLQLTGPVMVIAAIATYHARSYALAIVGAVLCLPTRNCLPVFLGIYALVALSDPKVKALFLSDETLLGARADPHTPAKPLMPRGYGDEIGSTLSHAWTEWWRERDALFTRGVQTVIMLLHIVCLLAFLGFSARRVTNDEGRNVYSHNIGFPAPWFTVETTSGGNEFSFNHEVHWTTSAWVVAGLGLGLGYIYCRIEKVRNPDITFRQKPEAFMMIWGILALADVGLGAGMGQLAMNMNRQVKTTPSQLVEADGTKADVSEADDNSTRQLGSHELEESSLTQQSTIDPQVAALCEAVSQGNFGQVKAQLDANASVNAKDAEGRTLLMQAIASGHRSLALTLVVLGADLTEQDKRGWSALMYAVEARDSGFISRLRELEKIAWKEDSVERKGELRAFSGVERMLLEGRDFDLRNVDYNDLERQTNENGDTASLLAAREGDWEMYSQVSSTSDSLEARDHRGRTVAMHAAIHGRPEWFEFLNEPAYFGVAGKANVYIGGMVPLDVDKLALTDSDGKTALQLAEESDQSEIADILRRHLQAIVDNQTAEIDKGGDDVAKHQELRRQAWRALGATETAEEDLKKGECDIASAAER